MTTSSDQIAEIKPSVVQRERGGWLAVSEEGAPLGIGAVGDTEDEALAAFQVELAAWVLLRQKRELESSELS